MILNYDPSDCLTPEREAEIDAANAEEEVERWLASWSDDFNSDGWLDAARINRGAISAPVAVEAVRLGDVVEAA